MRDIYHYIIAILFLGAGIPLTYFGYEKGVNSEESGDGDDSNYILMMVFGLLFLILSVIIFGLTVHRKNKYIY